MKNFLSRRNDNDWGFNFFDDAFDNFFAPTLFTGHNVFMRTDVKQTDDGFLLAIDMPGFDTKDINLTLSDGYLTVSASTEQSDSDKYIKRERVTSCKRSFYVGDAVTEEDIKAKYDGGVLQLTVPKKEKQIPQKKTIQID